MKNIIFLFLIILLASFFRVFYLSQYPPSITADELGHAYTAYSILKTGRDEWGDFLPINPRGFGDYKGPLYTYLVIPFEALFGLSVEAVRLPSAVVGVLTVLIVYFLSRQIFGSKKIGLLSSLLLAISPWHIQYSRVAFESNLGVMLFSLSLLFFVKSFKSSKFIILAAFCSGLTLFTYHSFKIFTILFFSVAVFLYYKRITRLGKKNLLVASLLASFFIIITMVGFFFQGSGRRAFDAAIYSQENIKPLREVQIEDKLPQPWGRVINNSRQYIVSSFIQNYLGYYSTTFLFSPNRPDNSFLNLGGKGLLYVWEIIFIIYAVFVLVTKKNEWNKLLLVYLLLAPIPASLTREYMHAQRVQTFIPLLQMMSAFGFFKLLAKVDSAHLKRYAAFLIGIVIIWSLIARIDYYFFHTFTKEQAGLKSGYKEIVGFAEVNKHKYSQIVFTKVHSEPHVFVAFYSQMDPKIFQNYSKDWRYFEKEFKFLDMINYSLEKYQFRNINWEKDKNLKNSLIIGSDEEIPDDVKSIYQVRSLTGKLMFVALDTNL